jgi:mannosyl-3-phosphoglycerate phosphatase
MFRIVFTDLDGTLLDHETYTLEPALPAIQRLNALSVPLIFCSSKTAAELRALQKKLNIRSPFISENGGGIFVPKQGSDEEDVIVLGVRYEELRVHLEEISERFNLKVRRFEDMSVEELAVQTGLPKDEAELSKLRDFDLPFVIERGEIDFGTLEKEVRRRGLNLTRGARFFHLMGSNDKGKAVKRLVALYQHQRGEAVQSIGLGDSANDLPLLGAVDIPVVVPNPESMAPLCGDSLGALQAPAPGPSGWNSIILSLFGAD